MIRLLLSLAILWVLQAVAVAHTSHGQVYEAACCRSTADAHGGDCAPIPEESVTAGPDGWVINLKPGDHPLVTRPHRFVIAYNSSKIRPATNGMFHICLWPTEDDDRCLYVPPQGF
jgi:hypothetical protein